MAPLALEEGWHHGVERASKETPLHLSCARKKKKNERARRERRFLFSAGGDAHASPLSQGTNRYLSQQRRCVLLTAIYFPCLVLSLRLHPHRQRALIAMLDRCAIHFDLRSLCADASICILHICAPRPGTPSFPHNHSTPHTCVQRNAAPLSPRTQSGEGGVGSSPVSETAWPLLWVVKTENSQIHGFSGPFGCKELSWAHHFPS